jgi:hypothetical protein
MRKEMAALACHMDGFLDALTSRDLGRARLAETVRYTENGQHLPIGEGAWATVDRLGGYRHDFADATTGNIATIATIVEGKSEAILVARLQVENDDITQIEAMVARSDVTNGDGLMAQGPSKFNEAGKADDHWFAPIAEAERMSRAELRRVANMYFAGIEKNDGKGDYPFSDDCIRIENGFRTTGMTDAAPGEPAAPLPGEARAEGSPYTLNFMAMSAKEQLETGFFAFVDRIRHRRFPVIDEERGLVFAFGFFDHSGTVRSYTLADGRTIPASLDRPFTWEIGEAFKIEKGLITRIEAVMTPCPYGMPPNWPMHEGDIL